MKILLLILFILMLPFVMAEDYEIESQITNVDGEITFTFADQSQILSCDSNFDIKVKTKLPINLSQSTVINAVELNNTLSSVVNRETSVLFMNQQQWFLETFIPLTADMNTMNGTISSLLSNYQSCTEFLSNEKDKLQIWNQTWNTQLDSCQSDKSSIMWFVGIFMTLVFGMVLATIFLKPEWLDKIKMKKTE